MGHWRDSGCWMEEVVVAVVLVGGVLQAAEGLQVVAPVGQGRRAEQESSCGELS